MSSAGLSRTAASAAAEPLGWRLVVNTLAASVAVAGLPHALEVAAAAAQACGGTADDHLRVDVRAHRVDLALSTPIERTVVTERDVELATAITAALGDLGLALSPPSGEGAAGRPVQTVELAIDALDIPAVLPFWRTVLGYVDEPGSDDSIVDPVRIGPTIWFQQMDVARPQRNRIHFDVVVSHDEAPGRIRAALDAGGVLVEDAFARSFWVLADCEGNEVCVCTWQDRDRPDQPAASTSA